MAKKKDSSDEPTGNEATGFSGFGGHSLRTQNGVAYGLEAADNNDSFLVTLSELGIEDAEQLIALNAIPGVRADLETILGPQADNLSSLLSQIQTVVPQDRLDLLSKPAPKDFGLGVIPPTQEMMATAESMTLSTESTEAIAIPASINLIPYMSPIRNQGPRGTCVSFALTALNEYILRRRGFIRDLSEQHFYFEIKQIDGSPGGCGTWQVRAVQALANRGECLESIWPYNPSLPCNNHGPLPVTARPNGLSYRLNTLAVSARSVLSYKSHMALQRPVTISIPVYNSWYQSQETRRSGRITMRVGNEPIVGGHAVCLVGYQDTPTSPGGGFFIVRNSWSTSGFGYQCPYGAGYGTIPYQYITNDAYLGESFTAVVPGITADGSTDDTTADTKIETSTSTVTIDIKPNITITIKTM